MITIGIDPSLNSTGVCILRYNENDNIVDDKFFIIKPNKLTKREITAQNENDNFNYVLYSKTDLSEYKDINILQEYHKTQNLLNIADCVYDTVCNNVNDEHDILIVQEGISYGSSLRTKSIFDLAGLNYLLRNKFMRDERFTLYICTPSSIKKYASGNGNCKKDVMIKLFEQAYDNKMTIPKIDDIADAYFMARYAHKLKKEQSQ